MIGCMPNLMAMIASSSVHSPWIHYILSLQFVLGLYNRILGDAVCNAKPLYFLDMVKECIKGKITLGKDLLFLLDEAQACFKSPDLHPLEDKNDGMVSNILLPNAYFFFLHTLQVPGLPFSNPS
jgi:hypothetical protein